MSILGDFNTGIDSLFVGSSALITALGGTAIYRNSAPDNEPVPYVVWNWQNFMDENQTPSKMFDNILNVRTFAGSALQADTIFGIIDGLLDGHTIPITGQTNFFTVRTMPFEDVETDKSGVKTYTAGSLYRIRAGS